MPLRPVLKRYSGRGLCAGPYTGIKGSDLVSTGGSGPSIPFPLATLPSENDVEFRIVVGTIPVGLTFTIYPDFTFLAAAADGTYDVPFVLEKNGTPISPESGSGYALRLIFGNTLTRVSSDLAGTYLMAGRVSSDLAGTYSTGGRVSSDLAGTYALAGRVSSDLAGTYQLLSDGAPTTGATVAEIWAYVMPNGQTAAELLASLHTRLLTLDAETAARVMEQPITGGQEPGSLGSAVQEVAARVVGSL